MTKRTKGLLSRVRHILLYELADFKPGGFGLSWLVFQVAKNPYDVRECKKLRGQVQLCLSTLAKEGILFTRQGPERSVQNYEHGEVDKRFRYRISPEIAKERLSKFKT
jgi:hypothetical protein